MAKVEILRQSILNETEKQNLQNKLDQAERENQDLSSRQNAITYQNTPSYRQLELIDPQHLYPVKDFEDSSARQDIEQDYTLDSLQQLEFIESQNIELKNKLGEQEALRNEMKSQFENRKKHLEQILRNITRGHDSPQKTSDFDTYIIDSQDMYEKK